MDIKWENSGNYALITWQQYVSHTQVCIQQHLTVHPGKWMDV